MMLSAAYARTAFANVPRGSSAGSGDATPDWGTSTLVVVVVVGVVVVVVVGQMLAALSRVFGSLNRRPEVLFDHPRCTPDNMTPNVPPAMGRAHLRDHSVPAA